jgi:8-oxo-dGTP diphosphatase
VTASSSSPAHRIVAGILIHDGRALLCHRSTSREWFPDVWDLPGGHVEAGETEGAALVRELQEELGVTIAEPAGACLDRVTTEDFDMKVWLVTEWTGSPTNASSDEHDQVDWFSASEAVRLDLAHASYVTLIPRAISQGMH